MEYNFQNIDGAYLAEILQNGFTQTQAEEIAASIAALNNKFVVSVERKTINGTNQTFGSLVNVETELYIGSFQISGYEQGSSQVYNLNVFQQDNTSSLTNITQDNAGHVMNFNGAITGADINGSNFFRFRGWKFTLEDL